MVALPLLHERITMSQPMISQMKRQPDVSIVRHWMSTPPNAGNWTPVHNRLIKKMVAMQVEAGQPFDEDLAIAELMMYANGQNVAPHKYMAAKWKWGQTRTYNLYVKRGIYNGRGNKDGETDDSVRAAVGQRKGSPPPRKQKINNDQGIARAETGHRGGSNVLNQDINTGESGNPDNSASVSGSPSGWRKCGKPFKGRDKKWYQYWSRPDGLEAAFLVDEPPSALPRSASLTPVVPVGEQAGSVSTVDMPASPSARPFQAGDGVVDTRSSSTILDTQHDRVTVSPFELPASPSARPNDLVRVVEGPCSGAIIEDYHDLYDHGDHGDFDIFDDVDGHGASGHGDHWTCLDSVDTMWLKI